MDFIARLGGIFGANWCPFSVLQQQPCYDLHASINTHASGRGGGGSSQKREFSCVVLATLYDLALVVSTLVVGVQLHIEHMHTQYIPLGKLR